MNLGNITFHPPHQLVPETINCWLVAIKPCAWDTDYHTYTLLFDDAIHNQWRAECYVPNKDVGESTQENLKRGKIITIEADAKSWARCTFRDLVGENERRGECVRAVDVVYQAAKYSGHVYVPSWAPVAKSYQSLINRGAKKSVELKPPPSPPPRRTVEFLGPIRAKSTVRTEVWSLDGESSYRGGATVLSLEVENGRRYLTIRAPVDVGQYALLVGDVGDTNWARCGRFEEVDDPEQKASPLFDIPPWKEEE
ncbi:hypothetical protein PRZ48_011400 [Zasmidium cellare]|uniref:Uncharacterized protein n=1 Tax=Zasmidium cellare TaxID=395010 RepID=A0ABR0E6A4_ZASCE|nr:hypothetical protein PRZ48_011400 [Zasmidium cellare]